MLVDPSRQEFIPGEDRTGDGTALNVRALYQRCPHLGCKPNPCVKSFWLECACHGSRYDRLGTKVKELGPAPRGMDRFARDRGSRRHPGPGHRARSPSARSRSRSASRAWSPPRARRDASDDRRRSQRARSSMTDQQPGQGPEQRLPVPREPVGGHARGALHRAPPGAHHRALGRACREDRPPERELALGRLPRGLAHRHLRHRLLLLRARGARASRAPAGWTRRRRPSRSRTSSGVPSSTRRTARAVTETRARAGSGRCSTTRPSSSPT